MSRRPVLSLSTVSSAILVACALLVTAVVVRREFFSSATARPVATPIVVEVEEEDLRTLLRSERRVGGGEAPLQVVEFIDFQCRFCGRAAQRVDSLLNQFPGQLAIVYRHFPLDAVHPYATDAAVAAECAADQGRFKAFHDELFSSQESIGTEEWSRFADRAALEDLDDFEACMTEGRPLERVNADVELGRSIGVSGTPAFVIRGRLFVGLSAVDKIGAELERMRD